MQHPNRPAVMIAWEAIAPLQQTILAWMDADQILPDDGLSILALLERARDGLTRESAPAARAGIEAFIRCVEALVEAGLLEAAEGHARLAAAAALAALLPGAGGSDG